MHGYSVTPELLDDDNHRATIKKKEKKRGKRVSNPLLFAATGKARPLIRRPSAEPPQAPFIKYYYGTQNALASWCRRWNISENMASYHRTPVSQTKDPKRAPSADWISGQQLFFTICLIILNPNHVRQKPNIVGSVGWKYQP